MAPVDQLHSVTGRGGEEGLLCVQVPSWGHSSQWQTTSTVSCCSTFPTIQGSVFSNRRLFPALLGRPRQVIMWYCTSRLWQRPFEVYGWLWSLQLLPWMYDKNWKPDFQYGGNMAILFLLVATQCTAARIPCGPKKKKKIPI